MNIKFYNINYKVDWRNYQHFEFYILPMLRYMDHGIHQKWIQFRWLVWGINWRIK